VSVYGPGIIDRRPFKSNGFAPKNHGISRLRIHFNVSR
jgi:hypothetical protein